MGAVRGQKRTRANAAALSDFEGRAAFHQRSISPATGTDSCLWPQTADRRPSHLLRAFLQLPLMNIYPFAHVNTEAHMSKAARQASAIPLCFSQVNGAVAD